VDILVARRPMWWLQLRLDFDSTAVRLFFKGYLGHNDVTHQWPLIR